MEEIDISQLLSYFKSKWIYILFVMSIAFCLSSIYVNRFRVPEYTSSTTILLNQANENTAINTNDINLNKSLVSTYSEIIKSKRVLRQVIEVLDLDLKYNELVAKVSVGEITDTSIIRISVVDPDSELAADIANSIADIFSKEIVDIYKIENISIIDEAEITTEASSASTLKIVGICTVAGALLSIMVIFVMFYFDKTIKNEEDIEQATGLPVIGIVPISREKIKYSAHRKHYEELARKHKKEEVMPVKTEVRKVELNELTNHEKEIGISAKIEELMKPEEEVMEPKVTVSVEENKVIQELQALESKIENIIEDDKEEKKVEKPKKETQKKDEDMLVVTTAKKKKKKNPHYRNNNSNKNKQNNSKV